MQTRTRRLPRKIRRGRAFRYRPDGHDGVDVIAAYGNRDFGALGNDAPVGRIRKNITVCADGYRFSAIAGRGTRSWPHPVLSESDVPYLPSQRPWNYRGPYLGLECDFPLLGVPVLDLPITMPVTTIRELIGYHGGVHHLEGPHLSQLRRLVWLHTKLSAHRAGYRFTCPHCGTPSASPDDAANRYCARCHRFVDDPVLPASSSTHRE